jgi:hypothetical protein
MTLALHAGYSQSERLAKIVARMERSEIRGGGPALRWRSMRATACSERISVIRHCADALPRHGEPNSLLFTKFGQLM